MIFLSFRCNFAVRNLADNIHTYTVQCSLPINLFNEKIFLIIWFWLYFTTLFTLFGFIYWIASFINPHFFKSNLVRYLSSMKRVNIHHFPQNIFQEQQHHHHHRHRHNSHHNRRYSFAHSPYGSMHASHHHHHGFLTSFNSRTLKSSFDVTRVSHVREQLNLPTATVRENALTPQRTVATRSNSFSKSNDEDDRNVTIFLRNYLGRDGTLVLYILQKNTNEVITGEIVTALYELFKTNYRTD
jgi:hypothetical protein